MCDLVTVTHGTVTFLRLTRENPHVKSASHAHCQRRKETRNIILITSPPRHPNHLATMPKENKQTEAADKKRSVEQKEVAVQRAVKLYKTLARLNPEKLPGYRTVCEMVEDELERETGIQIKLCYNTVRVRLKGMFGDLLNMTER